MPPWNIEEVVEKSEEGAIVNEMTEKRYASSYRSEPGSGVVEMGDSRWGDKPGDEGVHRKRCRRADFCWLLSQSIKTLKKANGMKRIEDSMYIEAHTRSWLSGLERDPGQDPETTMFGGTYIGVE